MKAIPPTLMKSEVISFFTAQLQTRQRHLKYFRPLIIAKTSEGFWKVNRLIPGMQSMPYFLNVALRKHPEVKLEWVERIVSNPIKQMTQAADGRIVYWGNIPEMGDRALRVITLEDGETIHNAFFDRNFYRRQQRGEEPS